MPFNHAKENLFEALGIPEDRRKVIENILFKEHQIEDKKISESIERILNENVHLSKVEQAAIFVLVGRGAIDQTETIKIKLDGRYKTWPGPRKSLFDPHYARGQRPFGGPSHFHQTDH